MSNQSGSDSCSLNLLQGQKWETAKVSDQVLRWKSNEEENVARQDTPGCVLWQGDWVYYNYFQAPRALCTWLHVTHMLPLINGWNRIFMIGNAGLQKNQKHSQKISAKISPAWNVTVNDTEKSENSFLNWRQEKSSSSLQNPEIYDPNEGKSPMKNIWKKSIWKIFSSKPNLFIGKESWARLHFPPTH